MHTITSMFINTPSYSIWISIIDIWNWKYNSLFYLKHSNEVLLSHRRGLCSPMPHSQNSLRDRLVISPRPPQKFLNATSSIHLRLWDKKISSHDFLSLNSLTRNMQSLWGELQPAEGTKSTYFTTLFEKTHEEEAKG